jgi:phage-related protein
VAVSILGEAAIRLRPDAGGFQAEAQAGIVGPIGEVAKKAAGLFAAAFAAEKVGEFLKESVTQASDLSESTSKVGVVFGDSAQEVLDFAANASSAFGQTRGQALEAAGTFGNLLRSIGLTADESANMSTKMVGLASDLASFNNTDPAEALEALRAGLTGETEPLKRYGINLNDATLKAEALRLGLDASGATLSSNVKAQAAYSLIMQQSTLAQGDFARTSAGLANQQRIMSSQWKDLQANIGGLFVPALANASGLITGGLLPALISGTSELSNLGDAIGSVGDVFRASFAGDDDQVTDLLNSTLGLGNGISAVAADAGTFAAIFGEAMADGKAGADLLAADGFDGLAARAGVAAHHVQQEFGVAFLSVKAAAAPALEALAPAFASTWASVKASAGVAFSGIASSIGDAFGGGAGGGILSRIASMIGGVMQAAAPIISGALVRIADFIQPILPVIRDVFSQLGPIISNVFSQLAPVFAQIGPLVGQILPVVMQVATVWRDVFMGAFQALLPILPIVVQAIGQLVSQLAGALGPILTGLMPVISALVPVISAVASAFTGALIGAIQTLVPILPPLIQAVMTIAQALMGAFLSALQALLPALPPIVQAIATIANALMGAFMAALQAVLPVIPQLVDVVVMLLQSALTPLLPLLPVIANLIATVAPILANLLAILISALAPILPVVVQLAALLIQLALSALMPLMPIITLVANLLGMLLTAFAPLIQIVITIAGIFLQVFGTILQVVISVLTTIISTAISFVSGVLSVFTTIIGAVTGIFGAIFGVIRSVWDGIFGFVSGIVSKVAGVISGVFSGVADAIGGVFSGIGNAVHNVFDSVVGFIKGIINGAIGILNSGIDFINSKLIDTANKVPFVNIPHIPHIPTLHEGGVFQSHVPAGEGLALLRDDELVITPEQRTDADRLLRALLDGNLPPAPPGGEAGGAGVQINQHITQLPGESGAAFAARSSADLVWDLNNGATRRVGAAAGATP